MKKQCIECGDTFVGRVDKKFCSDACRNSFNNRLNSDSSSYMRNVNNVLRKNRRILESHLKGEKSKVHRDTLLKQGFNFDFFTNVYITQKGSVYNYCYELGYLALEADWYLVVKREF
jgi:hypothetical protein